MGEQQTKRQPSHHLNHRQIQSDNPQQLRIHKTQEESEKENQKEGTRGKNKNKNKEETNHIKTGWKIEEMEEETREKAKEYYVQKTQERMYLDDDCTAEKVEDEAEWLRNTITDILDRYAPAARVCKRSKPWWNQEIKEQRKIAGRAKRLWMHGHVQWEKLKEEEKILYRTIRKHKRRCWDKWKQTVEGKDVWKAVRCTREREG
jgi:hypothetical protein